MGIINSTNQVVRNKSSPENGNQQFLFLKRQISRQINNLGEMSRLQLSDGQQFSGLLLHDPAIRENGKLVFTIISSEGTKNKIAVRVDEEVSIVHWHDLIDLDRTFQFVTLDKKGRITLEKEEIKKIPKVTQEEFENLVADLIKKERGK